MRPGHVVRVALAERVHQPAGPNFEPLGLRRAMSDSPVPRDVRMRGFSTRAAVRDVWEWIDAKTGQWLSIESVRLAQAHGRVLAEDVIALRDVPEFERSAMDGFALRSSDTALSSEATPVMCSVLGTAFPGRPFHGVVGSGQAVQIMTGAPVPPGADAVIPVEATQFAGETVQVRAPIAAGKHVGRIGEDIATGQKLLTRGRRMRPQDVALLASLGHDIVPVIRQPRVRVLVTGNELVAPGTQRGPYQIFDSNTQLLLGLIARDGGLLIEQIHVADDRDLLRQHIGAPGADVLLVAGGSSVGLEDHAPTLIAELGELPWHGVAMRPAGPSGVGRIGSTLVCLLPGNPVSCLCAYDVFAGRLIRRLGGRSHEWPYHSQTLPLLQPIDSVLGRMDYLRVRITAAGVEALALSGAARLSSTVTSDGFLIVPDEITRYEAGTPVTVWQYDAVSS